MPLVFNHNVIETPIDTINILGAGGLREGTITEVYGRNRAGKSSFVYDVGSRFQRKYQNGEVIILDAETSIDTIRMSHTFAYDLDRVHRCAATTLEEGFQTILNVCQGRFDFEKDRVGRAVRRSASQVKTMGVNEYKRFVREAGFESLWLADRTDENRDADIAHLIETGIVIDDRGSKIPPVFVIWDSIAASMPQLEMEAALTADPEKYKLLNAAGMGAYQRIMKSGLKAIGAQMYDVPVTVMLLNQISTTGFGTYFITDHNSSGGNALKHWCHYRLWFDYLKPAVDKDLSVVRGTISKVSIEKSKFSPTLSDIQIYIDDTIGGRIRHVEEIQLMAARLGVIRMRDKRYYWADEWESDGKTPKVEGAKTFFLNDIRENEDARRRCIAGVTAHFRRAYSTLDHLYREAGIATGEPTEEERQRWHSPRPVTDTEEEETGDILV